MAFDCFLKIDGVEGESLDDKHKGEIELLSINWGAVQTGTAGYGGGSGGGRVNMEDFVSTKRFDKASPKLMLACCNGDHLQKAVVTVRKAGKEQQEYLKLTLSDVLVSSVTAGASSADDIPLETLSLAYGKIQIEYKEQKSDGTLGGSIVAHWDVKANKGG